MKKSFGAPGFGRALVICLLGILLVWADDLYTVHTSSSTVKRKHGLKKLRAASEKMLTSNPGFQGPSANPLPSHSPKLPPMTPVPLPAPEASGVERFLKGAARVMTTSWDNNIFVWLPALSTDPNSGPSYGILPVLVLTDKVHHRIQHLLAPSYTYNSLFGQTGTMRYYYYPKDESQLFLTGSVSQHTNDEIRTRYEDAAFLGGRAFIRVEGNHSVDGSPRFYGLGPDSHEGDQAGYTAHNTGFGTAMGVNFMRSWRASLGLKFYRTEIGPNVLPGIEDVTTRFPTTPGLAPEDTVYHEFRLLWDSRDLPVTPSRGSSGELFVQKTDVGWGSDADYIRYGLEGKRFFPWEDPNKVTVIHGLYDWANGPNIPFYDLPSLGGRDTLRGYGEGRFYDRGRILFNLEQRFTVASIPMMGVQTKFEVAPFFDLGSVFPTLPQLQRKNFVPVYGSAFRAVVVPNVVGSIDCGIGKEGAAVFVGIDYPF